MTTIIKSEEHPLIDFVQVYKKALTATQCTSIIRKIEDDSLWEQHRWSGYNKIVDSKEPNRDCNRTTLSGRNRLLVSGCVDTLVNEYRAYISRVLGTNYNYNGMTIPGINKYDVGQGMRSHVDHITAIFDGETKGIPTLSVVGLLNNDFDGGEFKFWDNYDINLEIGDIMIFPSNFLYKHQVDTVTRGIRYSFVSWIY